MKPGSLFPGQVSPLVLSSVLAGGLCWVPLARAETIQVNSNSTLAAALGRVLPGDTIVMADGDYAGFTARRSGSSAAPILIRAAHQGLAHITTGLIHLTKTTDVTVEGLTVTSNGAHATIDGSDRVVAFWFEATQRCRVTRSTFRTNGANARVVFLSGASDSNRVDFCELGPTSADGIIYVYPAGNPVIPGVTPPADRSDWANGNGPVNPNISRRTQIDHNLFRDHAGTHEAVILGGIGVTGDYQDTESLVELNLFDNYTGDNEVISVKSSSNVIRYNTFRNTAGYISLRAGNRTQVYGNVMLQQNRAGSGGVRLFENDHVIYNNYIADTAGTPIDVGDGDPYDSPSFGHAQAHRAQIVHNTIVNSAAAVAIGHSGGRPLDPDHCVYANNLYFGNGAGGTVFGFSGSSLTFADNIVFPGSGGTPSGFQHIDPQLASSGGLLKLTAGSPAVDAADPNFFSFVTTDVDGQARTVPDIGADELSSAPVVLRPLTRSDVGPNAAPAVFVFLEAESGTLTAPMQTLNDPAASGGKGVTVAAGSNSKTDPPANGHLTLPFNVGRAGTFRVWGRVIAPTTADDSFWVRMDGGGWTNWNEIALGAGWHWDSVHDAANGNQAMSYALTAGAHTLTIAYREDGTRLDKVLVTSDLAFVPTGAGQQPIR